MDNNRKIADFLDKLMDHMTPEQIHSLKEAIVEATKGSLSKEPILITEHEFMSACEKIIAPIVKKHVEMFSNTIEENEGRISSKDVTNAFISFAAEFSAEIDTTFFIKKGGVE